MKRILAIGGIAVVAFVAVFALQAMLNPNTSTDTPTTQPETQLPYESTGEVPTATIVVEGYGTLVVELYPDVAPNTVNNFIALAESGYYDGLTFHRIINNFMIQGGDPEGTGSGGPGYSIPGEFAQNGHTGATLSHTIGTLSMARTQNPDSAGSQFFIVSGSASHLDGQYATFGQVVSGIDLIDAIQNVETNRSDAPTTPVVIESVTIDLNGYTPAAVIKTGE